MPIRYHTLMLASNAAIEFVDLSSRITINELDGALQRDMVAYLEQMAAKNRDYGHNRATVDGRDNAHAHILGLFMPASESIAVRDGELALGVHLHRMLP